MNGFLAVAMWTTKQVDAQPTKNGLSNDLGGREPILIMPAIEHHLHPTDTQRQHTEANPVEAQVKVAERARHEENKAQRCQYSKRQIDVENVAPVIHLGQVAAESGPKDRSDHYADAPDGHSFAALLNRIDVHHCRLRQRY